MRPCLGGGGGSRTFLPIRSAHSFTSQRQEHKGLNLAAGAIVSRPTLPLPRLLLPLPDHVHTPRNTSAISL